MSSSNAESNADNAEENNNDVNNESSEAEQQPAAAAAAPAPPSEREQVLDQYRAKIREHKEIEARLKGMRESA